VQTAGLQAFCFIALPRWEWYERLLGTNGLLTGSTRDEGLARGVCVDHHASWSAIDRSVDHHASWSAIDRSVDHRGLGGGRVSKNGGVRIVHLGGRISLMQRSPEALPFIAERGAGLHHLHLGGSSLWDYHSGFRRGWDCSHE